MTPKVYVKICGICSSEDASLAFSYGADLLGMVFHQGSSRICPADTALRIQENHPDKPRVLVFGHDPAELILRIYASLRDMLTYVQIPADHREMKEITSVISMGKIIPAVAVDESIDKGFVSQFDDCPLVIFDTAKGKLLDGTVDAGGSGKTFDWGLLKDMERPYLLAGGLNPVNLMSALELLDPLGVDVSSGIESRPAKKDPKKMRNFIDIAASYQRPVLDK